MQIWWFYQIYYKLSCAYANFPRILSQMVKMSKVVFKFKVSDTYFQYQLRVIHDAYLVQLWWFQLQSVTRYRADKVKFLTNVFLNIHHTVQFFPNTHDIYRMTHQSRIIRRTKNSDILHNQGSLLQLTITKIKSYFNLSVNQSQYFLSSTIFHNYNDVTSGLPVPWTLISEVNW